jgi:hypothetical protein
LKTLYFGNKGRTPFIEDEKLPCRIQCPACSHLKYRNIMEEFNPDIKNMDSQVITNHNLFLFLDLIKVMDRISLSHDELISDVVPKDYFKIYKSIQER